jgi:hypothetical protein
MLLKPLRINFKRSSPMAYTCTAQPVVRCLDPEWTLSHGLMASPAAETTRHCRLFVIY